MNRNKKYTILLTGSRAPAALELARVLSKGGARILAADSGGPHICESSYHVERGFRVPSPRFQKEAYISALIGIVRDHGVDLMVPCTEDIFFLAENRDRFEGECELLFDSIDVLRRLHHKGDFIKWAGSLGLAVPETQVFDKQTLATEGYGDVRERMDSGDPFVLKPAFTRFSNEVVVSPDGRYKPFDLAEFAEGRDLIFQKFLPGQQINTFALAHQGELLFNVAYRGAWTAGRGASIHFTPTVHRRVTEWIETFVRETGFSGQISFDFMELDETGEVMPIECNPRVTSGVHLLAGMPELYNAYVHKQKLETPLSKLQPAQVRIAMVTFGLLPSLRHPRKLARFVKHFSSSRDVVLDTSDLQPFFYQFYIFQHFARKALANGTSLQRIGIEDMIWNDEAPAA